MPSTYVDVYTTKDTVPLSTAFSPTMTSTKGRSFAISAADTRLQVGAVIYVAAQNATRRVVQLTSSTTGKLDRAFDTPLSAATVRIILKDNAKLVKWTAAPAATKYVTYNGETLAVDIVVGDEASDYGSNFGVNFVDIPVIDGTVLASPISVTYTIF